MGLLTEAIHNARCRDGRLDIVAAGNFNCHDQLWGGDEVTPYRQGDTDPIIDFMSERNLESMWPRGTKTWQDSRHASTIDLILVSYELALVF